MAVAAPALARLDAIFIGASHEVLFAASCLAASGKSIALLNANTPDSADDLLTPCIVETEAAERLDLVSHGLRFGEAPPVVAVAQDRIVALWPDMDATQAGLAALSPHDAAAYRGFVQRVSRMDASSANGAAGFVPNLQMVGPGSDPLFTDTAFLRGASLARVLAETFLDPLLQGALAQFALADTGTSPSLPGSARLLARQDVLALLGISSSKRHVAGGKPALTGALKTSLRQTAAAALVRDIGVKALVIERDSVQGVELADGTQLRAPHVIMSPEQDDALGRQVSQLPGLPRSPADASSARILYTVAMPPAIRSLGASLLTSGASVLLNPAIERLVASHGAFVARRLLQDFCISLHVNPVRHSKGPMLWQVIADIPFVPPETEEGPWSGARRQRLVSAITKAIDAWAPGFELSLQGATLVRPSEPLAFLDQQRPISMMTSRGSPVEILPDLQHDGVYRPVRGLWVVAESLAAGAGHAGIGIAGAIGAPSRMRGQPHA
jgi:phytoene dehydrogenase-like protein